MRKIQVKNTIRTYQLVFPPNMNVKSPLIVALHGHSGNAKTIEQVSGLNLLAEKNNFFVVYPNGFGTGFFYSWNAKFCCGQALANNSNDVLFIEMLIQFLIDTQPIDPSRIFVTGISNGGMMVNRIGIELGRLISGIAIISGAIGISAPVGFHYNNSQDPLDVLIIHGLKDTLIPYDGGKGVKENDPNYFLPAIEQVKYWITVNKCDEQPSRENIANGQVIKEIYSSKVTGKKVVFYTLTYGTHSWPGGTKGLQLAGEPVSKDVCDASQIVVDFLIFGRV